MGLAGPPERASRLSRSCSSRCSFLAAGFPDSPVPATMFCCWGLDLFSRPIEAPSGLSPPLAAELAAEARRPEAPLPAAPPDGPVPAQGAAGAGPGSLPRPPPLPAEGRRSAAAACCRLPAGGCRPRPAAGGWRPRPAAGGWMPRPAAGGCQQIEGAGAGACIMNGGSTARGSCLPSRSSTSYGEIMVRGDGGHAGTSELRNGLS